MRNTKLTIEGMTCGHCKMAVEKTLQKLQGVESVAVDLERGTASVSGEVSRELLVEAIEEEGYDVTSIMDSV